MEHWCHNFTGWPKLIRNRETFHVDCAHSRRLREHREHMSIVDAEIDSGRPLIFIDIRASVERSKAYAG